MPRHEIPRSAFLSHVVFASILLMIFGTVGCGDTTERQQRISSRPRMVTVSVAHTEYAYDGYWGRFDIASSAKAISPSGGVVAEARVTTPESVPISSLEVEEIIYSSDGSKRVAAVGSIRFDTRGRVIAYQSTSGLPSPIFNRWYFGAR